MVYLPVYVGQVSEVIHPGYFYKPTATDDFGMLFRPSVGVTVPSP